MSERERDALKHALSSVAEVDPMVAQHPATTQTQGADGNVSVVFDDGGPMTGASNVPCVYGLPGAVCKVPQGTRARVEFDNGDPRKRTFGGYDAGCPVTEINLADASSTQGAARNGDPCGGGSLSFVPTPPAAGIPTGGILFYTPQPSIETPSPVPIPFLSFVGPVLITQLTPGPLPINGNITGGSTIVKIGG